MRKKHDKRLAAQLIIAVIAASWTTPITYAEEANADEGYQLPEVVVTAAKIEQPVDAVTQKVTVISEKEIASTVSGNRNIAELLLTQPGISVSALSRNDANWGSYGGLGPKYNTYMLDGLPIDSFADAMALDPAAFIQIESQRGAASVLYANYLSADFNGNQTPLAGTTNFRLRDNIDHPLTSISVGLGSYDTKKISFYNQGVDGAWSYFVGGSYEKSDYTNYGSKGSWLNMLKNPQYDKTKLYFKTTYNINADDSVSLFVNHTSHTGDAGRINRDYDHNYDIINFDYKNKISDTLRSEFKIGYRDSHRRWAEDNADYTLREHDGVKQRIIPMDLTFTQKTGKNSILTYGADYQHADYETYAEVTSRVTQNKADSANLGIFIQQEKESGPWTFRVGGRFNKTENNYDLISGATPGISNKSWDKFLWSAGARYKQNDKVSWYCNVGTSFVAPGAKQVAGTLLASDEGVAGRNGQLPNPGLKPEKGIATDLGVEVKVDKDATFGLRVFQNKVTDTIIDEALSGLPAGTSQTRARNVGKTTSKGVEIEYKQKIRPGVAWFANYTYTDAKIHNPGQSDDGSTVPFVPQNMANVGLTWEKANDYSFSIYDHYTSGIYENSTTKYDGYHLINANFQKQLSSNVKANIDLYNIGNKKFDLPWQFRDPGFSAQASLEIRF